MSSSTLPRSRIDIRPVLSGGAACARGGPFPIISLLLGPDIEGHHRAALPPERNSTQGPPDAAPQLHPILGEQTLQHPEEPKPQNRQDHRAGIHIIHRGLILHAQRPHPLSQGKGPTPVPPGNYISQTTPSSHASPPDSPKTTAACTRTRSQWNCSEEPQAGAERSTTEKTAEGKRWTSQ